MIGVNWLTETTTDVEYKKYKFLAYFSRIQKEFEQGRLYPFYKDIIEGYKEIQLFNTNKQDFQEAYPKRIEKIDLQKRKIQYHSLLQTDLLMRVESVVQFISPLFEELINIGKSLEAEVKKGTSIEMVGVSPLYQDEGFVFIHSEKSAKISIYRYNKNYVFTSELDGLNVDYYSTENLLKGSFINIKKKIIKEFKMYPNPATFLCSADESFPLEATLVPIAKGKIHNYISTKKEE